MPAMPRILKDRATKVAFNILGKPATMVRNVKAKTKINKRITFEESSKVR